MKKLILAYSIGMALSGMAVADQPSCDPEQAHCKLPEQRGKMIDDSQVWPGSAVPRNTENQQQPQGKVAGNCAAGVTTPALPFRISVDGEPLLADDPAQVADSLRCQDLSLARADIQVRYDSQEQTPWLNVGVDPVTAGPDRQVQFYTYSNYPAWIERAEIRLFDAGRSTRQQPLQTLDVQIGKGVAWVLPEQLEGPLTYVLRVYDQAGRFDETEPRQLQISSMKLASGESSAALAVYGENRRKLANIPVRGGAVTVSGRDVQPDTQVSVMGQPVPVDGKGNFAYRQILPAGPHTVQVQLEDNMGQRFQFLRNISIARDDWFYIGLADLTVGRNNTRGPAALVTADDSDHFDNELYVDGRLAFYLKGKIKGEYLLTASADTREQPLDELFSNFAAKDPSSLLRRLDPDQYYPVYGDDSTTLDDAPTQGKFYVRLERGDSHVMWGNFHTRINDTELVQYNRGLYGARAHWVAEQQTRYGERQGRVELFAADPGTLPARDEFRGTGGSLYYLRRQDLTQGSERVWIEVRDKDTGIVLETRYLTPEEDYDINYIQGRIILREALGSTADGSLLIKSGSLSGHPAYLVSSYEYTPGLTEADDLVRGGRGEYWINDQVKIGATGYRQDAPGMEQKLSGADITLRYKPGTYVKIEGARSEGVGTSQNNSLDGGFSFQNTTSPGGRADAGRIEAAVDLAEVTDDQQGRASVYWQKREAGFSAPGQLTGSADATQRGARLSLQLDAQSRLDAQLDALADEIADTHAAEVNLRRQLDDNWELAVGVRSDSRDLNTVTASDVLNEEGDRTDIQVRADYTPDADGESDWSAYGYVQGTVDKSGSRSSNDRVGVGGKRRLSERFSVYGEASTGDGGLGGLIGGDFQYNDQTSLYSHYQMDTDRTDIGYRGRQGQLTSGVNSRFSDSVSVFGEQRVYHGEGPSGLTHAFGLDLTPNERWTYGINFETGELSDPYAGDMDRDAISLDVGYRQDRTRYAGKLEYRREEGTAGKRTSWLWRNNLGYQVDPDWRFLGRLNLAFSESSSGDYYDGDYVEVVTGYAYRPVDNDRLNLLFKYNYLYNLPSPGQLDGSGVLADYSQRSHVLSVDGTYDLQPWVSVGGKYAYRLGEMRDNRVGGEWYDSEAQLAVVRADFHWVHEWDVLVEGRVLDVAAAEDRRSGALVALYRHLGKNVKAGIGYNFTDFSDDLTDLSYTSKGWFFNIVMKM